MRNEHEANWSPGEVAEANELLLRRLLDMARQMFDQDQEHATIALMLREGQPAGILHLHGEDAPAVQLEICRLAFHLHDKDADAVILIGECWSTSADTVGRYERPSESQDKIEVLSVELLQRNGAASSLSAPINRQGERASLGEWSTVTEGCNFSLTPVHMLWKHPVPQEWRSMTEVLMKKAFAQRQ